MRFNVRRVYFLFLYNYKIPVTNLLLIEEILIFHLLLSIDLFYIVYLINWEKPFASTPTIIIK